MPREESESIWEPVKYGKFISQFQLDILKSIQQFERIKIKICRQKMSIIFNQIYMSVYFCYISLVTYIKGVLRNT